MYGTLIPTPSGASVVTVGCCGYGGGGVVVTTTGWAPGVPAMLPCRTPVLGGTKPVGSCWAISMAGGADSTIVTSAPLLVSKVKES